MLRTPFRVAVGRGVDNGMGSGQALVRPTGSSASGPRRIRCSGEDGVVEHPDASCRSPVPWPSSRRAPLLREERLAAPGAESPVGGWLPALGSARVWNERKAPRSSYNLMPGQALWKEEATA